MIDNSIIYNNPIIPNGFYYAKVIEAEAEPSDYLFPKLLIKLILHHSYNLPENIVFSAIIHPTHMSYWHYKNFFHTFLWDGYIGEHEKTVGQWGSVKIQKSMYDENGYSSVRFVYQPRLIRIETYRIMKAEKEVETDNLRACLISI